MSLKRIMLLATMALAVLAVPASASAHHWTEHGVPITANKSVTFQADNIFFGSELGGITCAEAEASATFNTTGGGTADSLSPEYASCSGSGVFEGCVLTLAELTSGGVIEINSSTDITLTSINIYNEFEAGTCFVENLELHFSDITLHPNSTASITSAPITGSTGVGTIAGLEVETIAGGTFTEPAGKYGIGA